MHKPYIAQLVYNATFPRPRPGIDPTSFPAHVVRNLVPEVRTETSTFYGPLDYVEAQYPGLDYTYKPHRRRLSRFPWHRRLFRVFDELRLTDSEISSLCHWEGTRSARERYEKETGIKIKDTTACGVPVAPPTQPPVVQVHYLNDSSVAKVAVTTTTANPPTAEKPHDDIAGVSSSMSNQDGKVDRCDRVTGPAQECTEEMENSDDDELQSYGVELNNHLMAATAARARGQDVPLDDAWERWIKEMDEQRNYTELRNAELRNAIRFGGNAASFIPVSSPSFVSHSSSPLPYAATNGLQIAPSSMNNLGTPTNSAIREYVSRRSETAR